MYLCEKTTRFSGKSVWGYPGRGGEVFLQKYILFCGYLGGSPKIIPFGGIRVAKYEKKTFHMVEKNGARLKSGNKQKKISQSFC